MGKNSKKFRKSKQGKGSGSLVSRAKQMRAQHSAHQARAQKQKKWQAVQEAAKRDRRRKNAFVPYSPRDFVLLVGEGNFSFTRALARRFGGLGTRLVATSYDTREQVLEKYPDGAAILEELDTAGVTVVHGVDATQLEANKDLRAAIATMMYVEDSSAGVSHGNAGQNENGSGAGISDGNGVGNSGSAVNQAGSGNKDEGEEGEEQENASEDDSRSSHSDSESGSHHSDDDEAAVLSTRRYRQRLDVFDKVVFNFPHTGCGIKDTLENNRVHQRFLTSFFHSAMHMLRSENDAGDTETPGSKDGSGGNSTLLAQQDNTHGRRLPKKDNYDDNRGDIQFSGKGSIKSISKKRKLSSSHSSSSSSYSSASSSHAPKNLPQIHVTLKTGEPYNSWQVPRMAKLTGCLRMKTAIDFFPELYSGYEHRRTRGAHRGAEDGIALAVANKDIKRSLKQGALVASRTYIFERPKSAEERAEIARQKRIRHQKRVTMRQTKGSGYKKGYGKF